MLKTNTLMFEINLNNVGIYRTNEKNRIFVSIKWFDTGDQTINEYKINYEQFVMAYLGAFTSFCKNTK